MKTWIPTLCRILGNVYKVCIWSVDDEIEGEFIHFHIRDVDEEMAISNGRSVYIIITRATFELLHLQKHYATKVHASSTSSREILAWKALEG